MSMFGCIVSGRLVQTDFQQVGEAQFVITIPEADTINHIVIFLTGVQPLPIGLAGVGTSKQIIMNELEWEMLGTPGHVMFFRIGVDHRVRPHQTVMCVVHSDYLINMTAEFMQGTISYTNLEAPMPGVDGLVCLIGSSLQGPVILKVAIVQIGPMSQCTGNICRIAAILGVSPPVVSISPLDGATGLSLTITSVCWPNPNAPPHWQILGHISNEKPSAIFKISNLKKKTVCGESTSPIIFDQQMSHVAQLGISVEPMYNVKDHAPLSSLSTVIEISQKVLQNFVNYVTSFAIPPSQIRHDASEMLVPLSKVQNWYTNVERRLIQNPDFWRT